MKESRSLVTFAALSLLILLGWEYFFAAPQRTDNQNDGAPKGFVEEDNEVIEYGATYNPDTNIAATTQPSPKLLVEGDAVSGSIDLKGLKFNNLSLNNYKQNLDEPDNVQLLSPSTDLTTYYAEFGYLSKQPGVKIPNSNTVWKASSNTLSTGKPVTLHWVNSNRVRFEIILSLDDKYMFHVKHRVFNNSGQDIKYNHYGLLTRNHIEESRKNMMVHEGGISVLDGKLHEYKFKDIGKKGRIDIKKQQGWIGFSDKYWLSALIPEQGKFNGKFARYYNTEADTERFQADFIGNTITLAAGAKHSHTTRMFIGAKELKTIEKYKNEFNIPLFDRAVDFGLLYFITKPIFMLLNYFYSITANFGFAIIALTIMIKALLFPLAYKGFKGMNKLKDLQPKMQQLKERYKDKPQEMQKATMELYKKEKVNPISGCLPLLLQMPVFFALYKVLYVNIEMRHAPFIWWLKDLSAPDPTSILTLFGLLPIDLPSFLQIGILPVLMSLSMYVQQKLSPQPAEPAQAMVMKFLPLMFLFMFASFPSGLVIYITLSNVFSIAQQMIIRKIAS